MSTLIPSDTSNRELAITRIFDIDRETMFEVWTNPEHIAHWFGPNGFTNTISEMDVRPGGVWRFVMHGPDGVDYPNKITYLEVVRPERLVYLHGDDEDPSRFEVTITFEEQDGQTKLSMRSLFRTAEELDFVVEKHGALEGMHQNMDRLDEWVSRLK
jgi:uncharacterized protein YndB with AHSA1/START domain